MGTDKPRAEEGTQFSLPQLFYSYCCPQTVRLSQRSGYFHHTMTPIVSRGPRRTQIIQSHRPKCKEEISAILSLYSCCNPTKIYHCHRTYEKRHIWICISHYHLRHTDESFLIIISKNYSGDACRSEYRWYNIIVLLPSIIPHKKHNRQNTVAISIHESVYRTYRESNSLTHWVQKLQQDCSFL